MNQEGTPELLEGLSLKEIPEYVDDDQHIKITNTVEHDPSSFDLLVGRMVHNTPTPRRIFVNRSLWMDRLTWIGFDMDYTLLRYHADPMEHLCYAQSVEKLIASGYDAESLRSLRYNPQRAMRGLLIDKQRGNILRINRHRHVGVAYHGHRMLDKEERKRCYRLEPLKFSAQPYHLISDSMTLEYRRFCMIDTLFGVSEACLYCDLIDLLESQRNPTQQIDYLRIYNDVRSAVDLAHAEGSISREIQCDMERYIVKDPEIITVLGRFRTSGKKLFLLTNSDWGYTDQVMSYLLNSQGESRKRWIQFFDLVIVRANKPQFFKYEEPFEVIDQQGKSLGHIDEIRSERLLRGGHQKALNKFLGGMGENILYVGDHIYGDILQTKKSSTWRTLLVIEELERELMLMHEVKELWARWENVEERRTQLNREYNEQAMLLEKLERLQSVSQDHNSARFTLEDQARVAAVRRVQRQLHRLQRELDEIVDKSTSLLAQINHRFNPFWGMMFREGHQYSYLCDQVLDFACLYTSRLTNFLNYAPSQYFRPPLPILPHELPEE